MWPSEQENNHKGRRSCTSAISSSSSSSSTPRRSMEEVWKDINLSSPPLYGHHSHQNGRNHHHSAVSDHPESSSLRGVILQDFLALASKETPATLQTASMLPIAQTPQAAPAPMSQAPHPATALSLNSGMDFHDYGSCPINQHHHHNYNASSNSNSSGSGNGGVGSFISAVYTDAMEGAFFPRPPAGIYAYCPPRKRMVEQQTSEGFAIGGSGGDAVGDRRQKRMIKNRESAARSRARKQAYTHELELEVQHLARENEKLKKQHEEMKSAMAAQMPTIKKLQRCKTSPF